MNRKLASVGKAFAAYAVIVVSLHFILQGWLAPAGYGALIILALSYVINSIREVLINKAILETYKSEFENFTKQLAAEVECSFCGKPNAVPFRMDQRNEFQCEHCGKPNLLIINATTAQITTPVADITAGISIKK